MHENKQNSQTLKTTNLDETLIYDLYYSSNGVAPRKVGGGGAQFFPKKWKAKEKKEKEKVTKGISVI